MRRTGIALIVVMALSPFLASSSFNTSGAYASSIAAIAPLVPSLHNIDGEKMSSVEVGQQAIIRVPVHNYAQTERSMVILVEVRDGSGVSVFLAWQITTIPSNSDYTVGMSWTPHAECGIPNKACSNYQIRSFVLSSLMNPEILSPVIETDGIIVTGSPPGYPGPNQYDLFLNNQTFQIDYSFSGGEGEITRIEVDQEISSMLISLSTPKDSRLSISMPPEFVEYVFPNIDNSGMIAFADEISVLVDQTIDSKTGSFTFIIPLEQGTEQLELLGSFLI